MRFLLAVIDSDTNTANGNEIEAIDAFNEMLEQNDHWIFACGVASPSTAYLVDNRADANLITHGPLNRTEEHMSGFWLVKADTAEVARSLALQGSKACNRKVEVRALL